jgi:two-component sensor histidine kinase
MGRGFSSPSAVDALADFISDLDVPVMALGPTDRILFANGPCADILDVDPEQLPGAHILRLLASTDLQRLLDGARGREGPNGAVAAVSQAGRALICHARRATGRPGVLLLTLEADGAHHLGEAELAHRIRNSLQMISSIVTGYEREGSTTGYAAIRAHLSGVAALYDLMEQAGGGRAVRADRFLEQLAAALRQSLLGPARDVTLRVEAEPLRLAAEQAGPVGVIVNELVTNCLKHAFAEGAARGAGAEVTLRACRIGSQIRISVVDNGQGAAADAAGGVGSRCISALVRQLRGHLEKRRTAQGYEVSVTMPGLAQGPPARTAEPQGSLAATPQAPSVGGREGRLRAALASLPPVALHLGGDPPAGVMHRASCPNV